MSSTTPNPEDTEETGLNLFDDRASAAGSFPHAMLGYDRPTVDNYVRELEQQVATLKQLTRHLRAELNTARSVHGDTDFTRLGSHATTLLRAAEAQSSELVARAAAEAERIKQEGRRVAADLRANAQTEADDIRVESLASLREMRAALEAEATQVRTSTAADAEAMVSAARTEADTLLEQARQRRANDDALASSERTALLNEAHRAADELTQEAGARAEKILTTAQSRSEGILSLAHDQAATLLNEANGRAAEIAEAARQSAEQAAAQLAEARKVLAQANEQAQQIRSTALADAESLRAAASAEAQAQVTRSHQQAAMMSDRLEEQYAWRKEQLEREVNLLNSRKDTIISQMGDLQTLALEASSEFGADEPGEGDWVAESPVDRTASATEPTRVMSREELETTTVLPPVTDQD